MTTPRQNRVTPLGDIIAAAARGTLMGNRGGDLRNAQRVIARNHVSKRWIICELEYKGQTVPIDAPGLYTPLFFLDEATALAAGHRPCALCARSRFNAFRQAWAAGDSERGGQPLPSATEIDEVLHRQRLSGRTEKRTYHALADTLPDGAMVRLPGSGQVHLILGTGLHPWSVEGYGSAIPRDPGIQVEVVTPESSVRALRAGYPVRIHPSARQ